ncbi:UDP-N-acetylglucosamine transporter ROCK1-like [Magnolia sinica]|uniref:UDP-N-acetylglucosamine transporter ROCK1-like n=1 Tax=Magnolia sinica TaxID=86752 RepID=UPI002657FA4F|nr:UDP-N-acetylglucosamine transporter ROCK1-like [Magnolia sinica]
MGALFLLIIAAILLSFGEGSGSDSSGTNPDQVLFHGIIPVLVASLLSCLASSLYQWASQVRLLYIPPFSSILSIMFPFGAGEETQLMLNDCGNVYSWKPVSGLLLSVKKHSSCFMNVEMSIVGSLCLLASMSKSPDGEAIRQHGFFHGWTALTVVQVECSDA